MFYKFIKVFPITPPPFCFETKTDQISESLDDPVVRSCDLSGVWFGAQANDLTWVFRFAIEATVRIGLIVSYMLVFEWRLALVAIAIIPVVGAINKWYGNWLHANQEKVQASLASANSVAHGTLTMTTFSLCCLSLELSRNSLALSS